MAVGRKKLFYLWAFLEKFMKTRFSFVLCVGVGLRKPQARSRKIRDDMAKAKFRAERLAGLDGCYYRYRPYVGIRHRLHYVPYPR